MTPSWIVEGLYHDPSESHTERFRALHYQVLPRINTLVWIHQPLPVRLLRITSRSCERALGLEPQGTGTETMRSVMDLIQWQVRGHPLELQAVRELIKYYEDMGKCIEIKKWRHGMGFIKVLTLKTNQTSHRWPTKYQGLGLACPSALY